jgi:hypothetical protein
MLFDPHLYACNEVSIATHLKPFLKDNPYANATDFQIKMLRAGIADQIDIMVAFLPTKKSLGGGVWIDNILLSKIVFLTHSFRINGMVRELVDPPEREKWTLGEVTVEDKRVKEITVYKNGCWKTCSAAEFREKVTANTLLSELIEIEKKALEAI